MRYGIAVLTIVTVIAWGEENQGISSTIAEIVGTEVQQEVNTPTSIEVLEVFCAETVEELETSLTDGYPMPWLEEILNDESIPEEDRYWLDCRMRAHVAKYMHRFYDRNGNPVEVEAEWISPGEHYWQEHLMVNPVGEDYGWEPPEGLPRFTGEPGTIINLYGEQTGEMALTQRGIIMSRDGTIGVLNTSEWSFSTSTELPCRVHDYVCIMYDDGSFREIEADFIREWEHITVSQDGELVVACITDPLLDRANGKAVAFDHDGNILFSTEIGGFPSARPAISPDNKYIAIALHSNPTNSIVILDAQTGELLRKFPDLWVREVLFSPYDNWLGFAGNINGIGILDLSPTVDSWEFSSLLTGDSGNYLGMSLCANPRIAAVSGKVQNRYSIILNDGLVVYRNEVSNLDLSPNGYFAFGFNSRRAYPLDYEPSSMTVISIRERG